MSTNENDIRVDDLVLFFRDVENGKETIVNRLVPHEVYTAEVRKVTDPNSGWKDTILAQPKLSDPNSECYYVVNLGQLLPVDATQPHALPPDFWSGASPAGSFAKADLVVFPPADPKTCFHIPFKTIKDKCQEVPARFIADLEFMAQNGGAVLANAPKVTPQGCTCYMLSLVALRSGMLSESSTHKHHTKDHADKTAHANAMPEAMQQGHKKL